MVLFTNMQTTFPTVNPGKDYWNRIYQKQDNIHVSQTTMSKHQSINSISRCLAQIQVNWKSCELAETVRTWTLLQPVLAEIKTHLITIWPPTSKNITKFLFISQYSLYTHILSTYKARQLEFHGNWWWSICFNQLLTDHRFLVWCCCPTALNKGSYTLHGDQVGCTTCPHTTLQGCGQCCWPQVMSWAGSRWLLPPLFVTITQLVTFRHHRTTHCPCLAAYI